VAGTTVHEGITQPAKKSHLRHGSQPWPGTQKPPLQWSPVVHGLASEHGAEFGVPTQTPPALHASSVHGFPSEQGPKFGGCVQTPAPSQTSSRHTLPSSGQDDPDGSN